MEGITIPATMQRSLSFSSLDFPEDSFNGDGVNLNLRSGSENTLRTLTRTKPTKKGRSSKDQKEKDATLQEEDELATKFLYLRNDFVRPKPAVEFENIDKGPTPSLDTVSTSAYVRYFEPSKVDTLTRKRNVSASACAPEQSSRSVVPIWQREFVRLTKEILAVVERWEAIFEQASDSIVSPTPQVTHFENYDTVDITTLLYLVGLHVSWLEPDPKDVYSVLVTVFSSLSQAADLCTIIINLVNDGLKRLKVFKPVLQELQRSAYDRIVKGERSTTVLFNKNSGNRPASASCQFNGRGLWSSVSAQADHSQDECEDDGRPQARKLRTPSTVSPLTFIIEQKHNVSVQTMDAQGRTIETQSERLGMQQKLVLIKLFLVTITDKLNDGFKGVGKLEIGPSYRHAVYKLRNDIIPKFLVEAKRLRYNNEFTTPGACSRDAQYYLWRLYRKMGEHRERLDRMHENVRWILLALETINHQRKIWAYPHLEINHLPQVAKYGMPKEKSSFLVKKMVPKSLRKPKKTQESICVNILPFDRMFEPFVLSPEDDQFVELSLEVDKELPACLFEEIESGTPKYYTNTIFLSNSNIALDRDLISGLRNPQNRVLYLKQRRARVGSAASSTNGLMAMDLNSLVITEEPGTSCATAANGETQFPPLVKSSQHVFWTRFSPSPHNKSLF